MWASEWETGHFFWVSHRGERLGFLPAGLLALSRNVRVAVGLGGVAGWGIRATCTLSKRSASHNREQYNPSCAVSLFRVCVTFVNPHRLFSHLTVVCECVCVCYVKGSFKAMCSTSRTLLTLCVLLLSHTVSPIWRHFHILYFQNNKWKTTQVFSLLFHNKKQGVGGWLFGCLFKCLIRIAFLKKRSQHKGANPMVAMWCDVWGVYTAATPRSP